jgi:hypothetical protein
MMPRIAIKEFSETTKDHISHINNYPYSGWTLATKVNDDEKVIDIGCGANVFKGRIKNLIGIDPAAPGADVITSLQDYQSAIKFDVAFCLGSFRYGTRQDIEDMISAAVNLLKPSARIYWRCRPYGTGHGPNSLTDHDPGVDINKLFYWSDDDHKIWSKQFGFELVSLKREWADPTEIRSERIYAEWKR